MATILGIDIGTRSVRGALLRSSFRALTIERYLEVEVSGISPESPRTELVQAALRELIAQLPEPPDQVIVAIDGARSSLRALTLPPAAKKRMAEVLPFELEPLLPFPIDEAVIDYQEIGQREGELAILAAAVPESVVAETIELYAGANLTPRELAVGASALDGITSLVTLPSEGTVLLLHVDHGSSDVCILRGKSCELARTLNEGLEGALERPFQFRAALHQTVMKYRADGGPVIDKVLVLGHGADDPAVLARVKEALGEVEVEPIALPPIATAETEPSPLFGKALALAGRTMRRGKRLDLRKGKFAPPRGVSQLRDHALLVAVCAFLVVMSYGFSVWAEYRALSEERDALAAKLSKVTEQHFGETTESAKRARELLEGGGQQRDPLPRFDAFRALGAISAAVPDSIVHDTRRLEITLDENGQSGSFELQGQIPDLAARDVVAEALDAHDCIEQLERGKTSTVPGQDRKNYTLGGLLACPGAKKAKSGKSTRAK
jgi:general secretion pathway protein L